MADSMTKEDGYENPGQYQSVTVPKESPTESTGVPDKVVINHDKKTGGFTVECFEGARSMAPNKFENWYDAEDYLSGKLGVDQGDEAAAAPSEPSAPAAGGGDMAPVAGDAGGQVNS